MSCAYRSHRYRASVTAYPTSVSWKPTTSHAHHPISLHPLVVHPERQVVTEISTSTDDASIPVSLVQYLWAQWQVSPSERDAIAAAVGELMRSPRWRWDVTVLPDQSLPDPQHLFVTERDGRPTIAMPITMLWALWRWVLDDIDKRASVLRRLAPTIDPALWQSLRTYQPEHVPRPTKQERYRLYGYLSPVLLPDIAQATHHLLSSASPDDQQMTMLDWLMASDDDQQMALTMLEQWLASDDHATRRFATHMLATWLHARPADGTVTDAHLRPRLQALMILASDTDPPVICAHLYHLLRTARTRIDQDGVQAGTDLPDGRGAGRSLAMGRWMSLLGEMVRDHPSDVVIREVLDRIMPAILSSVRPDDRVAWAATLWDLMTDSTLPKRRRQTIATALTKMMQEPMVAAQVHAQLSTEPSLLQTLPAPICDTLLNGLIQTAHADTVLRIIAQTIRQDSFAIARFDSILAAGWGNGHDQRILQMITSHPSPDWREVLRTGITTSVGAEVCAFIQSWFSPDQAFELIVRHIEAREQRGDWPLAPLPAHLIPWVGEAARVFPNRLHPTTIRRLWLTDPVQAWHVTQTMLDSDDPFHWQCVIAAMDAGWGTGHAAAMATILRSIILDHPEHSVVVTTGIATAVAGIGTAPPSIMESLLTELAMKGNDDVQYDLIHNLHHGWGRGQDALVLRIVAIIAERDSWERIWVNARETLIRAWDCHPPDVVVSLIDRVVTRATNRLAKPYSPLASWEVQQIITAFAPIWTHLPPPLVIERIAHHVAHLRKHAHSIDPSIRDTLVAAWAAVVTAGVERLRLSASDIQAVLAPLWHLSPHGCLTGITQWVHR